MSCFDLLGESESAYLTQRLKHKNGPEACDDEYETKCDKAVESFVDAYMRTYNEAREQRTIGEASAIENKLHATADSWKAILQTATGKITSDNIAMGLNGTLG